MKALKVLAVLSLLVIFPAISYLYLMKGYNFRLGALQELETKETIDVFPYLDMGLEVLEGKASLIFDADADESLAYLLPVYEEFSHREEFQMLAFSQDSSMIAKMPKGKQWFTIIEKYPYQKSIALVDTSASIRNFYEIDSSSFTKLIQHIPIIIPRKKEKDIVLKREDEK